MPNKMLKPLTASDKLKIIREFDSCKTCEELCSKLNEPKCNNFYTIIKKKMLQLQCIEGQRKLKRIRLPEYPEQEKVSRDIDEAMF